MDAWLHQLGSPAKGVVAALAILLAAFAIGLALSNLLRPRACRHPMDHALVAVVLGLDVTALALLGLGSVRFPSAAALAVTTALLAAAGTVAAARALARSPATRARLARPGAWGAVVLLVIGPLGGALCLPVGWDELSYHVEVPMRWLEAGRALVFPDNPYSGLPSAPELLYTLGIALGGITAPRALALAAWILCGAATYRLLRRDCGPRAALALAAALSWMPVMLMVASETYVESFVVLQLAAMLIVLRHGAQRTGDAVGLGVLAAGAAAMKTTGVILGPLACVTALAAPRRDGMRRCVARLVLAGAVAAIVAAPFYLRPWLATGNPTHPYYAAVFTPDDRAAVVSSTYHHELGTNLFGLPGWRGAIVAPVLLTRAGNIYSSSLGFQWPALLVLALIGALTARRARRALLAATLAYVAWVVTTQQARFLLPAVLLVTVAAAAGLARLGQRTRLAVVLGLVALTMASTGRARWMHFWSTWQAALGVGQAPSSADYAFTGTAESYLLAMEALRTSTPPDARVLMLFEPRGLYVPRAHVIGTPFFQSGQFTPPEDVRDAADLLARLRAGGFTHVLVGLSRRDPDVEPAWRARAERLLALIAELRASGDLRVIWERDTHAVLEVR